MFIRGQGSRCAGFSSDSIASWAGGRSNSTSQKAAWSNSSPNAGVATKSARAIEARQRESAQLIAAKTLDGQQLAALAHHRHYLERESVFRAAQRVDCEKRIAAQQQRVVEAERTVRLLERLKERRLAEWTFDFNREMEVLASETFLSKWAREKSRS